MPGLHFDEIVYLPSSAFNDIVMKIRNFNLLHQSVCYCNSVVSLLLLFIIKLISYQDTSKYSRDVQEAKLYRESALGRAVCHLDLTGKCASILLNFIAIED